MNEHQVIIVGQAIVDYFGLKPMKDEMHKDKKMYETDWGPKTVEGLARSMYKILCTHGAFQATEEAEEETRI
jgi:hypothetical protein